MKKLLLFSLLLFLSAYFVQAVKLRDIVECRKLEDGSQKMEVRRWKPEV